QPQADVRQRYLLDGQVARDTVEAAEHVLGYCDSFVELLKPSGHSLPQPLPRTAAGWICQSYRCNQGTGGEVAFERAEDRRRLLIDLWAPEMAVFEAGFCGGDVEISQRVFVDRRSWEVSTSSYQLKVSLPDWTRALQFSALVATLI